MKESISVNSLNKITENLDIVKVISEYINLKKAGKNFKALCPFHEEKTPSFIVNPEKQIFHCFGCGAGGDVIKFLMSIEHIAFPDAVALASEKAGLPIPVSRYIAKDSEEIEKIYRANEFALKVYQSVLFSDSGKSALEYLYDRNLKEPDVKNFHIGLAPNAPDYLVKTIKESNLKMEDFIRAGLVKEDGITDVFKSRLIFPIFNYRGKISGFGGRALDEKQLPKYLNTAENPAFNKGKLLYGLNWASNSIKEKNFAILVEGYFDVIKLHINGVKNVVAPMGTSLTGMQLNFLRRFTDKILLLFDSDQAGINACMRNLEIVLNKGYDTRVCILPADFDPDRFIDDHGIAPLIALINRAQNFLDFSFDIYCQQYDVNTPRGKSSVAREVMKYIELIPDEIEKAEYRKILASKLAITQEMLSRYIAATKKDETEKQPKENANKNSYRNSAENMLVEILLSDQQCWKHLLEWEGEITPRINVIIQVSREILSKNLHLTPTNLMREISTTDTNEELNRWISELAMKDISHLAQEKRELIFQDCLKKIHKICICEKLDDIKKQMTTKKNNGLQYHQELETLQTLLFELKKE